MKRQGVGIHSNAGQYKSCSCRISYISDDDITISSSSGLHCIDTVHGACLLALLICVTLTFTMTAMPTPNDNVLLDREDVWWLFVAGATIGLKGDTGRSIDRSQSIDLDKRLLISHYPWESVRVATCSRSMRWVGFTYLFKTGANRWFAWSCGEG